MKKYEPFNILSIIYKIYTDSARVLFACFWRVKTTVARTTGEEHQRFHCFDILVIALYIDFAYLLPVAFDPSYSLAEKDEDAKVGQNNSRCLTAAHVTMRCHTVDIERRTITTHTPPIHAPHHTHNSTAMGRLALCLYAYMAKASGEWDVYWTPFKWNMMEIPQHTRATHHAHTRPVVCIVLHLFMVVANVERILDYENKLCNMFVLHNSRLLMVRVLDLTLNAPWSIRNIRRWALNSLMSWRRVEWITMQEIKNDSNEWKSWTFGMKLIFLCLSFFQFLFFLPISCICQNVVAANDFEWLSNCEPDCELGNAQNKVEMVGSRSCHLRQCQIRLLFDFSCCQPTYIFFVARFISKTGVDFQYMFHMNVACDMDSHSSYDSELCAHANARWSHRRFPEFNREFMMHISDCNRKNYLFDTQ